MTPKHIDLALNILPRVLALRAPSFRVRMAAALVDRKGNLLSLGFNQTKTHPRAAEWHRKANRPFCTCIHAEMDCLMSCERLGVNTQGKTLVISRIKQKAPDSDTPQRETVWRGSVSDRFVTGLALPCPSCINCLTDFKITRTLFTLDDSTSLGELKL